MSGLNFVSKIMMLFFAALGFSWYSCMQHYADKVYAKSYNLVFKAEEAAARHNYKEAMQLYDEAIKVSSSQYAAFNNRGCLKIKLKDPGGSIDDFDKAIAIEPNFEGGYSNKGYALLVLGKHSEAIANYSRAIACRPCKQIYISRAKARKIAGDLEGAAEDLKRAKAASESPPSSKKLHRSTYGACMLCYGSPGS